MTDGITSDSPIGASVNRAERREAQRLKLLKYARWVDIPGFPGEKVQLRPCTFHDLLQVDEARGEAEDQRNLWPVISALVQDWSFTDDDGAALPLTEDAVRDQIPIIILKAVCLAAMQAVSGDDRIPFAPMSSSAPSPASPAKPA